jgi:hypothetical protein
VEERRFVSGGKYVREVARVEQVSLGREEGRERREGRERKEGREEGGEREEGRERREGRERKEGGIERAETTLAERFVNGGKFVGEFAQREAVLAKILVSLEEEEEDVNRKTLKEQADVRKFSKVLSFDAYLVSFDSY